MDTVPAYVDWRACTVTPLADLKVRLKLPPLDSLILKHLFSIIECPVSCSACLCVYLHSVSGILLQLRKVYKVVLCESSPRILEAKGHPEIPGLLSLPMWTHSEWNALLYYYYIFIVFCRSLHGQFLSSEFSYVLFKKKSTKKLIFFPFTWIKK
jgi:hypothetical protein